MKDEREILTREYILKKLTRDAQKSMVSALLTLVLGVVMFLILCAMQGMTGPSVSLPFIISEAILTVAFVAVCIFFLARGAQRKGRAMRGEFSVVEDALLEVKEDRPSFWRMLVTGRIFDRSNFIHVFTFQSRKTFVANSGEYQNTSVDTAARYSLPMDTFYLVFYDDAPQKVVWIYSTKIYVYKETGRALSD